MTDRILLLLFILTFIFNKDLLKCEYSHKSDELSGSLNDDINEDDDLGQELELEYLDEENYEEDYKELVEKPFKLGGGRGPVGPKGTIRSPLLNFPIEVYLLKKYEGLRIIGKCGVFFQVSFLPQIIFKFETKDSHFNVQEKSTGDAEVKFEFSKKCNTNGIFKLLIFIKDHILTIRWFVSGTGSDFEKETKKFKVPFYDPPINSIQVHTGTDEGKNIFSKNYSLKNITNEKCDLLNTTCFLHGGLDMDKCMYCSLLIEKKKDHECIKYLSKNKQEEIKKVLDPAASQTTAQANDDEDSPERKLAYHIGIILSKFFKTNNNTGKRVLINENELDEELKEVLKNYCNLLKEIDDTGTTENHELGDESDIFNNLTRMLKNHIDENYIVLEVKLKNSAICLKNTDDWIINRRGLDLSNMDDSSFEYFEDTDLRENIGKEYKINNIDDLLTDENGLIDLSSFDKNFKLKSPYYVKNKYCNEDYCDRWKDNTNCLSKIVVEDQGDCSLCWIFSSKLHLETIRCMRDLTHFRISPLFVANCSGKETYEEICVNGSNPYVFLDILNKVKFLPLERDYPYNYKYANNKCPHPPKNWVNLWGNSHLLPYVYKKNKSYTLGYRALYSYLYRNNIDEYVNIIKKEVRNKGSVIAYIRTQDIFNFDFNGRGIYSMCGSNIIDHAAVIIGYGIYIDKNYNKRSYWIIRNSWGIYWGDYGNFKIDTHGPENCEYNFIHTAVIFKLNLGKVEVQDDVINEHKSSYLEDINPLLYHDIYLKNYDPRKNEKKREDLNSENDNKDNKTISGAEEERIILQANDAQVSIKHALKSVTKNKVTSNIILYKDLSDLDGKSNSCFRVFGIDKSKDADCRDFCEKHYDECKGDSSSIGFCLHKKREKNDCFSVLYKLSLL